MIRPDLESVFVRHACAPASGGEQSRKLIDERIHSFVEVALSEVPADP
jgi:hypothetical protein